MTELTANNYLKFVAFDIINHIVGEYPDIKKDPQATATLVAGSMIALALENNLTSISNAIGNFRTDHPLQGQRFDGLEEALSSIAEAINNHIKED